MKEQTTVALAALAAKDAVGDNSNVALDMDFRILKSEITAVVTGLTNSEGEGLILYMTEGDLSTTEAEANIEQNGPIRLGSQVEEEIASRWVRRVGIVHDGIGTERVFRNKYGGGLLEATPRWTFRRARTANLGGWNWVIYNDGDILTTGGVVNLLATHYGVWVT